MIIFNSLIFSVGVLLGAFAATIARAMFGRLFRKPQAETAPEQPQATAQPTKPKPRTNPMYCGVLKANSPKLRIIKARLFLIELQLKAQDSIIRCGVTPQKAQDCNETMAILSAEQQAYVGLIANAQPN